jgi:hypothetical protein
MCMFCRSLFVLLVFFLLDIVLYVLLRFTDSDYPFGIFKLFLGILNDKYIYFENNRQCRSSGYWADAIRSN